MSKLPFMNFYVADYLGDTGHLSCEQHGAYTQLLFQMWRFNGKLPDDDVVLARLCHLSVKRWRQIGGPVRAFFTVQGGDLTQKRITTELAKAQKLLAQRQEAGRKGGRPKKEREVDSSNPLPDSKRVATDDANPLENNEQAKPVGLQRARAVPEPDKKSDRAADSPSNGKAAQPVAANLSGVDSSSGDPKSETAAASTDMPTRPLPLGAGPVGSPIGELVATVIGVAKRNGRQEGDRDEAERRLNGKLVALGLNVHAAVIDRLSPDQYEAAVEAEDNGEDGADVALRFLNDTPTISGNSFAAANATYASPSAVVVDLADAHRRSPIARLLVGIFRGADLITVRAVDHRDDIPPLLPGERIEVEPNPHHPSRLQ